MKIEKHDLFPVALTYCNEFLPADLASKIYSYILSLKTLTSSHNAFFGNAVSIHGEQHTTLIEKISKEVNGCSSLQENILKCVNNYAEEAGYPEQVIINSWFNIQNKNSVLVRHMHIGQDLSTLVSRVSGALYINVDEDSSPIIFENPNPYSFFNINKRIKRTKYNYANYWFKPKIGDLILFPSWLIHAAPEPNGMDNRITISFNTGNII